MDAPTISLLYLDRYHLGDPLFLQALGQAVARSSSAGLRPILVHGQGDEAQTKLEGQGIFIEPVRDVYHGKSDVENYIIEMAHRELNRRLVGILTEAAVPAVGFMGSDRGLIRADSRRVRIGTMKWLNDILARNVVPVIGTETRQEEGRSRGVDPVQVVSAFADVVKSPFEIVMFTTNNLGGIMKGRDPVGRIDVRDAIEEAVIADTEGAEMLVLAGYPVLLTNTVRYPGHSQARGTWLTPPEP